MALTITEYADARQNVGPSFIEEPFVLQPAADDYATGGYSIPGLFGYGFVYGLSVIGFTGTAYEYIWQWNATTQKLQVFQVLTGAASGDVAAITEVAAATDLSGGSITVLAYGC